MISWSLFKFDISQIALSKEIPAYHDQIISSIRKISYTYT